MIVQKVIPGSDFDACLQTGPEHGLRSFTNVIFPFHFFFLTLFHNATSHKISKGQMNASRAAIAHYSLLNGSKFEWSTMTYERPGCLLLLVFFDHGAPFIKSQSHNTSEAMVGLNNL